MGYEALGEFGIVGRRYFRKDNRAGERTHQIHAFQVGSPQIARHLAFRDLLRVHPDYASDYDALKQQLAEAHSNDISSYTDGKDSFIRDIDTRAASWLAARANDPTYANGSGCHAGRSAAFPHAAIAEPGIDRRRYLCPVKEPFYLIPPAVFAPVALTVAAIVASSIESWWILFALPFIWLGSICAAPNLNLADGCLTYIALILGFVVAEFFHPLGFAMVAGSILGYCGSAAEKWIRMRPAPDD
jgi:hypothetical protein